MHTEFATDVQNQLCSIRSDLEGQVEAVQKRHEDLNHRFAEQGAKLWDHTDQISIVQAQNEAHAEKLSAMEEEIWSLKRQLASSDVNHIHYHDNRVVLVE